MQGVIRIIGGVGIVLGSAVVVAIDPHVSRWPVIVIDTIGLLTVAWGSWAMKTEEKMLEPYVVENVFDREI